MQVEEGVPRSNSKADEILTAGLDDLNENEHGGFLCYPGLDLSSFSKRKRQLEEIGVSELILGGTSKVGKYGVIGKGCVSIVVKARFETYPEVAALKIRRTDANRPSMFRDYELQRLANSFGVGPKVISATEDFFAMEYVDSIKIGKWLEKLTTRASKKYTRKLIRNILEQCYQLDIHRLDHGELSNPSKHVLLRKNEVEPKTVVIDFESASTIRQPANLTAVSQFLFLSGRQSEKIKKIVEVKSSNQGKEASLIGASFRNSFISMLRDYKASPSIELLERVLSRVHCL